jgi:hypothetical protein
MVASSQNDQTPLVGSKVHDLEGNTGWKLVLSSWAMGNDDLTDRLAEQEELFLLGYHTFDWNKPAVRIVVDQV